MGADVLDRDTQYLNDPLGQRDRGINGRYGLMRGFKYLRVGRQILSCLP